MTDVKLDEKEQKAADAIREAMLAIRDLAEHREHEPANFTNEVIPAIHTLQMFVLMHWAHRIHPDQWSNWYEPPPWIPNLLGIDNDQSATKVTPSER